MSYTRDCGQGLFCDEDILKGVLIAPFVGKHVNLTKEQVKRVSQRNRYLIHISGDLYLECKESRMNNECKASVANTSRNAFDYNLNRLAKNNAYISDCKLYAHNFIPKDTEILWPYGRSYKL